MCLYFTIIFEVSRISSSFTNDTEINSLGMKFSEIEYSATSALTSIVFSIVLSNGQQ